MCNSLFWNGHVNLSFRVTFFPCIVKTDKNQLLNIFWQFSPALLVTLVRSLRSHQKDQWNTFYWDTFPQSERKNSFWGLSSRNNKERQCTKKKKKYSAGTLQSAKGLNFSTTLGINSHYFFTFRKKKLLRYYSALFFPNSSWTISSS